MSERSPFAHWLAKPPADGPKDYRPTNPNLPVLVVGAGPAGLAAMAALRRAGIEFVGAESHARAGGIWDISNPASSIYQGMRTVTSRFTSHVGRPMPDDWPDFVPHDKVQEYLQSFGRDEQLLDRIRFGTSFVDAAKSSSGTWNASLRRAGDTHDIQEEFRAIVFATGAYNQNTRACPVELRDQAVAGGVRVLHSSQYKDPAEFADRRVLVVGIGNSGSDIADKVSSTAARTLIAVRTGPWINPQTAFGVPCDKLTADTPAWLPTWYRLGSFHIIRWLTVGSMRRLGFAVPRHSLNDRLPIGDRGIVAAIRSGRVVVRSNVTSLEDGLARFADPAHPAEPVDAVIFATGFSRRYPLLCAAGASVDEVADALSFFIFHRSEPGLAYMAETIGFRGCWPVFVQQAEAIASYFAAEQRDAPNVRLFNARRKLPTPDFKGTVFAKADRFHLDYDLYERGLRDLSAWLLEDSAPLQPHIGRRPPRERMAPAGRSCSSDPPGRAAREAE